ncbi:hypothetical protein WJX74_001000 [Apatococcus lobatus]|uniref:Uncharacterized protein n=1 Tax=Apatococcus lobatus TaxID=904363 RepID=A0AAW1QYB0_9CHLO
MGTLPLTRQAQRRKDCCRDWRSPSGCISWGPDFTTTPAGIHRTFSQQLIRSPSWRRQLQTKAPAGIPKALFEVLEPSPLALSVHDGVGRALLSRGSTHQGQRLFQEWPLVCVPALSKQDKADLADPRALSIAGGQADLM